ncbi:MAG TPA: hypothetical protein VLH58_02110, partial [Candidatus Methylomirabilis sp.]|nr:hypothetical protein [Candidatus Methylomirabilis sp.]
RIVVWARSAGSTVNSNAVSRVVVFPISPTPTLVPADINSPAPGSTFTGASATFGWSEAAGATEYILWVGTAPGQHDLYNESLGLNQFAFVNNLPGGAAPVFVRLWTKFGTSEQYNDYTYTGAPFCF